jgi:hypothetical protein
MILGYGADRDSALCAGKGIVSVYFCVFRAFISIGNGVLSTHFERFRLKLKRYEKRIIHYGVFECVVFILRL